MNRKNRNHKSRSGHGVHRLNVKRADNYISILSLAHPKAVSDFLRVLKYAVNKLGYEELTLYVGPEVRVFPNACVPMAAIVDYFRSDGVEITVENESDYLNLAHFDKPLEARQDIIDQSSECLSRVWKFNDAIGVHRLSDAFIDNLSHRVECEKGVIESFGWCLSEIMDNVLQHADTSEGFIMVQIHREHPRVAICLADTGIGIFNSLRKTEYKPKTHVDAITLALKEGVTRDKSSHQGNGLWGLFRIVLANSGRMTITSGHGSLIIRETGKIDNYEKLPIIDRQHEGTIVDFQLDTNSPIDLPKALGGYKPINLQLEAHELDNNEHRVSVTEHAEGTGTRIAAERLRNHIVNLISQGASRIVLDFEGIGVISSSFADELVGKLVIKYGFYHYQKLILLTGVSDIVQTILHRSIAQRMMQSINDPDGIDDQ